MSDCTEMRLMKPYGKISLRLEREAIRAVAQKIGGDFIDVEEAFSHTRGALVHLWKNETYRSKVEKALERLVSTSNRLVTVAEETEHKDLSFFQGLAEQAQKLEALSAGENAFRKLKKEDIDLFLLVIEEQRSVYDREGYDSSGIVQEELLKLARMISANFEVYKRTLNEE